MRRRGPVPAGPGIKTPGGRAFYAKTRPSGGAFIREPGGPGADYFFKGSVRFLMMKCCTARLCSLRFVENSLVPSPRATK